MPDPIPETDREAPVRRDAVETIPVMAETARIEKRVVETGRAVIHKSVSERDEVINALLARHDVSVERVPVGQVVSELPVPRQDGDAWVIPVVEEQLVIEKQLVLKEELRIRTITRHEAVQETVRLREEHVDIEAVDRRRADPAQPTRRGDAR